MHRPGAVHSGGSCQISFSYDDGITWIVAQSWEGNCPRVQRGLEGSITNFYDTDQSYTFEMPKSLPAADVVIAAWYVMSAIFD